MPNIYFSGPTYVEGEYPSALAIGDSWFWYPNSNLLDAIVHHHEISRDHSNIQVVGFNGAKLQEYVGAGQYAGTVQHFLQPNFGSGFSEFYISGAGNDAVDIGLAIKADCKGIATPDACLDPAGLDRFLFNVSSALSTLIHDIRWAYRNDRNAGQLIFIHGYDYPVPDGRGFKGGHPWIKPKMDDRAMEQDVAFRKEFTRILIDRLNTEVLMHFHSPLNRIIHIDSRGTLSSGTNDYKDDWANEMHPTAGGFKKIVDACWIPVLKKYGIAGIAAAPNL